MKMIEIRFAVILTVSGSAYHNDIWKFETQGLTWLFGSWFEPKKGAINKLQLSADGKFLVSCGLDGNIFSYEVVPPEEVKLRDFKEEPIDQLAMGEEVKGSV